jgi:hypothetical protein
MKTVEFKWDLVSGGYDAYENGKINKGADGTYVLASEAKAEVDKANAGWIERCRKFREQDASEANERVKVLEDEIAMLKRQKAASEPVRINDPM